jgi:UDP-N-acetylglucosamine acyltransferase
MQNDIILQTSQVSDKSGLIDDRASIDPTAVIADDVSVGPWTVIGPNVTIGEGCQIGSHVVIECNTKIGKRNKVHSFSSIGGEPQDLSYKGEPTFLEIGDDNIIREHVTINRGSVGGGGLTRIGSKNCFLISSHVAHDCIVGNGVLMINHAALAGHVTIDDHATLGAFTAVHQYCRVGAHSFVSRGALVTQDILPYVLVAGPGGVPCGLNMVGLKRHNFSLETIRVLKTAYSIVYRRRLKLRDVCVQLNEMVADCPKVQLMLDIIYQSKRGIARKL